MLNNTEPLELLPVDDHPPAPRPGERANLLANWPMPPVSPWAPGELGEGPERAHLDYAAGRRVAGEAFILGADDGVLFRAEGGNSREHWVPLREFRALSLTRPLALAAPPSDGAWLRRRYRLELMDGTVREGESAGMVRTDLGVFLYPPAGDASVARHFIPSGRVRAFDWKGAPRGHVQLDLDNIVAPPEPVVPETSVTKEIETINDLRETLAKLARSPIRRLGEVLVDLGHISQAQLDESLDRQLADKDKPLGEVLIEMGVVKADQLKAVLAQKLGIPHVDARVFPADPQAQLLVPRTQCRRHRLIPLCFDDEGGIVVAMDNPMSGEALQAVRFASGRRVVPVLGSWPDIRAALGSRDVWATHAFLGALAAPDSSDSEAKPGVEAQFVDAIEFDLDGVTELTTKLSLETTSLDAEPQDTVKESDSTLVRLVNKIILDGHEGGASDIHFEPAPGNRPTRIRMRRDGVLSDYAELPAKFRAAIVSRIKIMANLDISERRKPQDGKIDFSRFGPAKLELRVATVPTNNSLESVILRLLVSHEPIPADKLGLDAKVLATLRVLSARPHGLLLVCGPTGSGKTTTLHSLLAMINTPERKIWTAEDPIEITQAGLSQVQVNPKNGWGFADALRTFLRADPDVIMIGEMRDKVTAETAVEASLTGHLVFSTLHTNSAPETVTRLLDLGVDPFNFSDSLLGVLAQRLVRRVCPACSKSAELPEDEALRLAAEYSDAAALDPASVLADWRVRFGRDGALFTAKGEGCEECLDSGYKGRLGVHEFMASSAGVRHVIQSRGAAEALRARALSEGMRTLKQDGIEKMLMGLTTLEQVRGSCG